MSDKDKMGCSDISELSRILDSLLKTDEISDGLVRSVDYLRQLELSKTLKVMMREKSDIHKQILSDVIKLPDRLSNIAAAKKMQLSEELIPRTFVSLMLLNLASAILDVSEVDPEIPTLILSKLYLNYRGDVDAEINKFWKFASMYSLNSPAVFPSILSCLDGPTLEKCVRSAAATVNHRQMYSIFGSVFNNDKRFRILENILFLRGLTNERELVTLVSYLGLSSGDLVKKILQRAFLLFADETYVEQGDYRDQLILSKIICSGLSVFPTSQISEVKSSGISMLMKGCVYWMDSTRQKRSLGMSTVLVVLRKFGEENIPEWDVEDKTILDQLESLANPSSLEEESKLETCEDILKTWSHVTVPENPVIEKSEPESIISKPSVDRGNHSKQREVLDSDDDDDDDLPAYDMSNDTVKKEEEKKFYYIRDVLEELGNPESDYVEDCLTLLPELCRRHLTHEDPALVQQVVKNLLHCNNKFGTDEWVNLRAQAMISVLETKPIEGARSLVPAFYDRNFPMDTRFGMLSWMVTASESISKKFSGKMEFSEYIRVTIQGLCGGASWGKLEFTGLDAHIVSQLLVSIGQLLMAGKNMIGWETLAADYLDLLLFSASSGRSVIETTCIHSISLVLSMVEPRMCRSLVDVLTRVGHWLQTREGELEDASGNALMMLALLQQEAGKLEMEAEIQGSRTISLKTPELTKV